MPDPADPDDSHSLLSLLASIFESTADGILVVDTSGRIVASNRQFAVLWNIPEELILRKNDGLLLDFIRDQLSDSDGFMEKVTYLYDHPEQESRDLIRFKDERVFERYSCPQRLGQAIIGRVWSFRDITKQQDSENRLRETAHFLQRLIDAIPSPIFYKDVQGVYRGCNQAFEAYLGLPTNSIIGRSVYDIAPRELADNYHEKDRQLFEQGGVQKYETAVRYADGSIHDVMFHKAAFTTIEGKLGGLVGVILDITERKRAEEAVTEMNGNLEQLVHEKTKQLHEANEELVRKEKLAILGRIIGSIGHDLRNPLCIMDSALNLLREDLGTTDPAIQEYLDKLRQGIETSNRIITDLLDFARTRPPQRSVIRLIPAIKENLESCPIPRTIELDLTQLDPALTVMVDPLQLGQILRNLITNAVQAMPSGGRLVISANAAAGRSMVNLVIRDTGIGISAKNMTKLFHPLFTTKEMGMGLGLVTVQNLVHANGGTIGISSREGIGTSVTLEFPGE
ncbi:MAG TPA: hypothetical protein DIC34_16750 [Treponema sp.]|nr:MAG: hypothetical protein A2Y36_01475 [Treponema sp. GWA1_62_8]OHE68309.1 MAG: hypothetical protein A2001_18920 [Treponema sp. GWC1_61_84]HCM28156.1 hypothetical protein [Treponema sp.]